MGNQRTEHYEFECALCVSLRMNPLLLPVFSLPGSKGIFTFINAFKPMKENVDNGQAPPQNRRQFTIPSSLLSELKTGRFVVQLRIVKVGPHSCCFPKIAPELEGCYEYEVPWNFRYHINSHKMDLKTDPGPFAKKRFYEPHNLVDYLSVDNRFEFQYWSYYQNESDKKPKEEGDYAISLILFMKAQMKVVSDTTYMNFVADHKNPLYNEEDNEEIAIDKETLDLQCPITR